MERKTMKKSRIAIAVLFLILAMGISSYAMTIATGTQDYRNQVIKVCGISDVENLSVTCTRAEFAKMLVLASSQRDIVGTSLVSAAADVPGSNEYSKYIRISLRNNWMRTRLNGSFDPNGGLTLNDAAKGAMTALGYTDSDFSGNVNEGRLAKFCAMGLNNGVGAVTGVDQITKQEAINVIYNMLKANSKNGQNIYGSAINLTLAADGELNATNVLDDTMQGPILIKKYSEIAENLPFALSDATCYYNGSMTSYYNNLQLLSYSSQLDNCGWLILYYNEATKTIWGYGQDTGGNAYHCVRGTVNAVYYDSDNIVSPTSVTVDSITYSLNSADVKFMFSINGTIGVGDEVVLICKSNSEGNSMSDQTVTSYYATGVVLYRKKGTK